MGKGKKFFGKQQTTTTSSPHCYYTSSMLRTEVESLSEAQTLISFCCFPPNLKGKRCFPSIFIRLTFSELFLFLLLAIVLVLALCLLPVDAVFLS